MIKVGIIGATGYAGNELVRLLMGHKEVEIKWYGSRSYVDQKYAAVYQNMFELVEDKCLDDNIAELAEQVDVIFTATPQGYLAGVLTPYAKRKTNGYISSRGTIYGYATTAYWLRYDKKYPASYVSTIGFSGDKMSVNTMKAGVRPAMWVDAAYVDGLLAQQ